MTKPLNDWAGTKQSDASKVNNADRDAPGPIVQDGLGFSDPNAMGPTMRPLYDATAGACNYPADMHDTYTKPYPRVQKGAVAQGSRSAGFRGKTGDDERNGPDGSW